MIRKAILKGDLTTEMIQADEPQWRALLQFAVENRRMPAVEIMAAKWAPSVNGFQQMLVLLCSRLFRKLEPKTMHSSEFAASRWDLLADLVDVYDLYFRDTHTMDMHRRHIQMRRNIQSTLRLIFE
jgi:hypothetical protein